MGYPVCSNRIHSSGINGPWKSLFETTKSFLGDGHRLKLFLGVWESGDKRLFDLESLPYPGRTAGTEDENRVNWEMKDKSLLGED